VRPELPQVARHRHGRDRRIGNIILTLDRAAFHLIRIPQQRIQILVGDPQQRQIKILGQQPCDLVAQNCLVPLAQLGQLVVGDAVGPAFGFVEVAEPDHRYVGQPQHDGGQHPAVPGDQLAIVGHQARHGPAELRVRTH